MRRLYFKSQMTKAASFPYALVFVPIALLTLLVAGLYAWNIYNAIKPAVAVDAGSTGWTFGNCSGLPTASLCNITFLQGIYMCLNSNIIYMCTQCSPTPCWVYLDNLEGPTGGTGVSGTTGGTGVTGMSGGTGYTGSSGATGMSGGTGYTGSSGATGMSGASGTVGFVNTTCQSVNYVANATVVVTQASLSLNFTNVTAGNLLIMYIISNLSTTAITCPTLQASQIATFSAFVATGLAYRIQTFQILTTAPLLTCSVFGSGDNVGLGQVYDGLRYSFKFGSDATSLKPPSVNWNGNGIFLAAASSASAISFTGFPANSVNILQASRQTISAAMAFYALPYNGTVAATPFVVNATTVNVFSATIVNDCIYAFGGKK